MDYYIQEQPNSPSSLMHLLPSTGDQINSFANGVVQAVRSGNENPLDILLQIKAMQKAFDIIKENIEGHAMREADKYPGDKFQFKGNDISKTAVRTEYDYEASNDPIYNQRKMIADEAARLVKERAEFLKTLKEPLTVIDDETGSVEQIRPPVKKVTDGLKFSIK